MSYMDSIRKIRSGDYSKCTDAERDRVARDVIDMCAAACAGLVLQPIPGLEQTVLPLQAMMVLTVAHIYGQELSQRRAIEILMDMARITGASIIGRQVISTLSKVLLPFVGGLINAPHTFSVTWATGYATIYYLRGKGRVDEAKIREIFEAEKERSKSRYSEEKARSARPSAEDLGRK